MYPYVLLAVGVFAVGYVVCSLVTELEERHKEKKRKNRGEQFVCESCDDIVSNIFYKSGKYICDYCRSYSIPCKGCGYPAEKLLTCKHKYFCKDCLRKKRGTDQCDNGDCALYKMSTKKSMCKGCDRRPAVEFRNCEHKYFCEHCFYTYYKYTSCPEEECKKKFL